MKILLKRESQKQTLHHSETHCLKCQETCQRVNFTTQHFRLQL